MSTLQKTLTGRRTDQGRQRPSTLLQCPECEEPVLRSRTDEHPHSFGTERIAFIDIYSGPGGVGYALDAIIDEFDLPVDHIGIDITDYSDTYPGDFAQCDASSVGQVINAVWYYLTEYDVVILWMSPPCLAYSAVSWSNCNQIGFDDPRDYYPTFADLNVRVVLEAIDPDEYIIENVANCEDIREPTRINGFGVGLPFDLERHFETSFPCPDRLDDGEAEADHFTRTGDWQSKKPLARTKGVPEDWDRQEIRSAMPRELVQYLLHYCPAFPEIPLPDGIDRQQFLTESFLAVTDGGNNRSLQPATSRECGRGLEAGYLCDDCRRTFDALDELADHNCRAPGALRLDREVA